MVTMVQLASAAGFGRDEISYSTGMQVVDGALVAVQGSPTNKKKGREHKSTSPNRAAPPTSSPASLSRWTQAWEALRTASAFRVDEDGEVALKFCDGLATIYRACCDGKNELAEAKRVLELLNLLQGE